MTPLLAISCGVPTEKYAILAMMKRAPHNVSPMGAAIMIVGTGFFISFITYAALDHLPLSAVHLESNGRFCLPELIAFYPPGERIHHFEQGG